MARFAPGTDFSLYYVNPKGGPPIRKDSEKFKNYLEKGFIEKREQDDRIPNKQDIVKESFDSYSKKDNSDNLFESDDTGNFLSASGAGVGGMDKGPVNEDRKKLFMEYLQKKMPEKYPKRIPIGYPAGYKDEELSDARKEGLRSIMSSLKDAFAALRNDTNRFTSSGTAPNYTSFEESAEILDKKVEKYDDLLEKLGIIQRSPN